MVRSLKSIVLICFLLSGVSSLIYEVVWTRLFVLVFGTTTFAVSTVLVAFMAGLALGSWWLGRFADRFSRPVFLYGLLEVGIGLYALFVPAMTDGLIPLSQWLWRAWEPSFYAFSLIRFLLAFAILILPTTLMGGTLPILSKFYAERKEQVGFRIGLLYGLNTLGAVIGAVAAGFVLLPEVGMRSTTQAAVTINLLVGFFAMAIGRSEPARVTVVEAEPVATVKVVPVSASRNPHALSQGVLLAVLIAFALSGFVAMIYELAWTRLLTLILGSSTYAFTIMLATFLVGLALGSFLMARWADRVRHPLLVLARIEIGVGLAALIGEHLFDQLPYWFLWLFGRFAESPHLLLASQFLLAFFVMFLPTLLLGAVFPLVVRIYAGNLARVGQRVGTAYAMNTLGTILGAFSAGFILLPALGIQRSVTLALVMNLLMGLALLLVGNSQEKLLFRFTSAVGVVLLIPLAIYAAPTWDPLVMSSGVYKDAPLYLRLYRSPKDVFARIRSQYQSLFYKEGVTATVTVLERPSLEDFHHLTLSIDGKVDASTAADLPTQILSAHLPLLVVEEAKKVMVIGWASGMTVGSVAQHPVEEIVAVEIEPAVIPASAFFNSYNHQPLKDPRVKLVINDARNHLLLSNETFDVIISEPSNPWMSGPAKLFTREFFQLGRARLRPGGIFTQWLQLYGMTLDQLKALLRTFHSVFPHVLIFQTAEADLILLGSDQRLQLDYQRIRARMAEPKIAADLQRVKVFDPSDLLVKLRLGSDEVAEFVASGSLNTDDNALIEFAAPKTIYLETAASNLEEIKKGFHGLADHLTGLGESPQEQANVYLELAKKYLDLEEWTEAEKLAEKSLALVNAADGHWVRAEVHLARGEDDRAVAEWQEALRLDAAHYGALMSLAVFHQLRRNYQEADRPLLDLLDSYPNDALAHYFYGLNLYFTGDYELAVEELKMALALGLPKLSLDGVAEEGAQAASVRQQGTTLRWWPSFLYEGLENQLAHYYLSLCYARLNDKEKASEEMRAFLDELHAWREALELRPATFTQLKLFRQFQFHQERGMYIEEEATLASLLDRFVAGPLTHFYRGTAEYFLGYYQEAVAELEAALNALGQLGSGARSPLTHYYLGLAYKKVNDRAQAASHLESFLSDPGSDPNAGLRMADARRQLEEIRHAQATGGVSS